MTKAFELAGILSGYNIDDIELALHLFMVVRDRENAQMELNSKYINHFAWKKSLETEDKAREFVNYLDTIMHENEMVQCGSKKKTNDSQEKSN